MKENLAKRLTFISHIIVVVFIIMIPVFLLKQEENDLRLDVKSFSIISQAETLQSQAETIQIQQRSSNLFNQRILVWLKREHKDLYNEHISLRQQLTDWLIENHLSTQDKLGSIKKGDEGAGFSLVHHELTHSDAQILSKIPPEADSVGQHLEYFDVLSSPKPLRIATKLISDLPNISQLPDPELNVQFQGLYLDGNEAVLMFEYGDYASQTPPPDIRLQVETRYLDAPARLVFLSENSSNEDNNQEAIIANEVATIESNRKRLETAYANIPFHLANQIASERVVSVYSTVNVLGFSLARKSLPWGILIIMIILLMASVITLKTALNHSLKIISEVVSEDAFDILLDSLIGRVAIWIVVPLLAIVASLPSSPLTAIEIVLLIGGGSSVCFLVIVAFCCRLSFRPHVTQ